MRIAIVILLTTFAQHLVAGETNSLWDMRIPRVEFKGQSLTDVFLQIEEASRQVDPAKRGIRILHDIRSDWAPKTYFQATNETLRLILHIVADLSGSRCAMVGDTALLFHYPDPIRQLRFRLIGVYGTCRDAVTRQAITNITLTTWLSDSNAVHAESPWDADSWNTPRIHTDSRGHFFAILPHSDAPKELGDVRWYGDHSFRSRITATAPGYKKKEYEIRLDKCWGEVPPLNIELVPAGKTKEDSNKPDAGDGK